MTESKPLLIVVTGPTGSGKTDFSIRLAKHLGCSILSADSRQIFKDIPIGTAAPTEDELKEVPHYFVGSHRIQEPMNAGLYEEQALGKLDHLFQENPIQVVCGGTGLYIKALLHGLDELPSGTAEVRHELQQAWEENPEALITELKEKDPIYAQQVDLKNKQRVIRALEIIRSHRCTYTELRKNNRSIRKFNSLILAIDLPREELYRRIELRTDAMIDAGWLEEAKLVYPLRHLNALQTVGYKELFEHLNGKLSLAEAIEKIKVNTRRYAKRQLTWIRNQETVHWISPQSSMEDILNLIRRELA